jgi:hypothetical protein
VRGSRSLESADAEVTAEWRCSPSWPRRSANGLATLQNVRSRQPRTIADLGADFLPDAQHIRDFKRVKVKDGRRWG